LGRGRPARSFGDSDGDLGARARTPGPLPTAPYSSYGTSRPFDSQSPRAASPEAHLPTKSTAGPYPGRKLKLEHVDGVGRPRSATNARPLFGTHHAEPARASVAGCDSPSQCGMACQLTEACGWDEPPRYVIRDRDGGYGAAFIRCIRHGHSRHRPVSARSPWHNGYAEG
jgi:hypothetical protein